MASNLLTRANSLSCTSPEWVKRNLRLFDFLVKICLLPEWLHLILPEPVTVKRFFALECVFSFGIFLAFCDNKKILFIKAGAKLRFFLIVQIFWVKKINFLFFFFWLSC